MSALKTLFEKFRDSLEEPRWIKVSSNRFVASYSTSEWLVKIGESKALVYCKEPSPYIIDKPSVGAYFEDEWAFYGKFSNGDIMTPEDVTLVIDTLGTHFDNKGYPWEVSEGDD